MSARVTALPNGLRVVSETMPSVETASIGVWVDVGARDERAEINGVSHMLEHMAFKGTKRRSARAIAEEVEAVGGHLNAYTSREQTAYYVKIMKEDVPLAVDILGDILQHSVFDSEELAREQQVIVQEIAQAHDTPDDIVFDYFQEIVYPDQPMGRSILGPAAIVESVGRDVLADYMAEHYTAHRMVVVGAGRFDHEALVDLVGQSFDMLPGYKPLAREPARYGGGDLRHERELEQLHLILGFDGVAFDDPDFPTMQVFSTLLGGGMSSRLFQEIREKRGLAYSVFSFASSYTDGGTFGVYAGTAPADAAELIPVMADELMKVCEAITEPELARARAQLKSGLMMSLESTSSRIERLGRHMLIYGRPLPIEEMVERIDAITPERILALAKRTFTASRPSITALGALGSLEPYDRIVGRFG
ncbi:MAG: insulinase family protein [Alphaproteobacteria bacterium]|nr:insulinase family protein [Alphaproteobacteria bacterium]